MITHTRIAPKTKGFPDYADLVADVVAFLDERSEAARAAGVSAEQLVLDPGIDLAKTPAQSVELLRRLEELAVLGRPLLVALSRKDFLGALTGRPPAGRLAGTLAALGAAADGGAADPARARRGRGPRLPGRPRRAERRRPGGRRPPVGPRAAPGGRVSTITIAQLSDLHCGSAHFVPSLLDRALVEVNELEPDVVIVSGDLTDFGLRGEYQLAADYLARIACEHVIVIPGNHDSRNVGYVHFEELVGERRSVLHHEGVSIVAVDSTEPDLDHGVIGRGRYQWIIDRFAESEAFLRIFVLHHHLLPVPGTGRERNVVHDAGDTLETLQRADVHLVLSGHKHVPYAWELENLFVVNAGTVSTTRLRGKTKPCYNLIEASPERVTVFRKYPFHEQDAIISFDPRTYEYEKDKSLLGETAHGCHQLARPRRFPVHPRGSRTGSEIDTQEDTVTATVEQTIQVDVPIRQAYDQWTQFEEFPRFMEGIEEIRQLDDRKVHWVAEFGGERHEWDAEITEQSPEERVAWSNVNGKDNAGVVTFHKIDDDTTRVAVQMDWAPEGIKEKIGSALGADDRRVKGDLERFKEFIESRGSATGEWRGEVPRDG